VCGVLHVQIMRAHDLSEPVWGMSELNPYVAALLDNCADTQVTQTAPKSGTSPMWPQQSQHKSSHITFNVDTRTGSKPKRLNLQIWDKNRMAADDFIGSVHTDLNFLELDKQCSNSSTGEFMSGEFSDSRVCRGKVDTGGSLLFLVWFVPCAETSVAVDDAAELKESHAWHIRSPVKRARSGFGANCLQNRSRANSAPTVLVGTDGEGPDVERDVEEHQHQRKVVPVPKRSMSWSESCMQSRKVQFCVQLAAAQGLEDRQLMGRMDPFVVAHLIHTGSTHANQSPQNCRSGTAWNGGTSPRWRSSGYVCFRNSIYGTDKADCLRFDIPPGTQVKDCTVLLEIWNSNMAADEFVGSSLLHLPPIGCEETSGIDLWHPVNTGGSVKCCMMYIHD